MTAKVDQLEQSLTRDSDDKRVLWGPAMDADGSRILVNTISSLHRKVEEGKFFTASKLYEGVTNGSSVYLVIEPETTDLLTDMFFHIASGGNTHMNIYHDPNLDAVGTAMKWYNHNRNFADFSAPTSPVIRHTPTVASAGPGDMIFTLLLPGGDFRSGGASAEAFQEWIFESAETYLLEAKNDSGGTVDISMAASGYTA